MAAVLGACVVLFANKEKRETSKDTISSASKFELIVLTTNYNEFMDSLTTDYVLNCCRGIPRVLSHDEHEMMQDDALAELSEAEHWAQIISTIVSFRFVQVNRCSVWY